MSREAKMPRNVGYRQQKQGGNQQAYQTPRLCYIYKREYHMIMQGHCRDLHDTNAGTVHPTHEHCCDFDVGEIKRTAMPETSRVAP